MSGEGADELFGGYVIYHEPVSLRPFKVLPAGLKKKIKEKLEDNKKNFKGKNYLIRGCTPIEERFIGNAYLFHPKEKAKSLKEQYSGRRSEDTDGSLLSENQKTG